MESSSTKNIMGTQSLTVRAGAEEADQAAKSQVAIESL